MDVVHHGHAQRLLLVDVFVVASSSMVYDERSADVTYDAAFSGVCPYEDDLDADWASSQFSRDGLPHGLQHGARIVPLDKELWALDSCTPCASRAACKDCDQLHS